MKKNFACCFLVTLLFSFFVFLPGALHAQNGNESGKKKVNQWYNGKEWLHGLKVKPHQSIDKLEFEKEYHARQMWWDKAFAFMKNTNLLSLEVGDHPIVGEDVFARVTEIPLKSIDSSKWEAHKNFHDIHYVITGREKIGIGPLSSATVVVPYDNKRDIAFYNGQGKYYTGDTGNFFIAFTKHIHRPGLQVDGKNKVKKLVIKIRSSDSK